MMAIGTILLSIGLLVGKGPVTFQQPSGPSTQKDHYDFSLPLTYKERAFQILDTKCNVCHRRQNKKRVFTPDNMSPWAQDIYEQVFEKRRMPRGNRIKLTQSEYDDLLTWINSTPKF
ncbi:hypothetical protein KFE98_03315 [bacterium SCSIO 12741]|nr:hypothetical protein KFE98_03315 [bacterium SCSIO 12741]